MGDKLKGKMNVGVDLGTSNLLIYVEGRGTVFNEPSIIAIDKATRIAKFLSGDNEQDNFHIS